MILIDTPGSLAELILILIDTPSSWTFDTPYLISIDNGIDIEMKRKSLKIGRKLIRKPFLCSSKTVENSQKQWIVQLWTFWTDLKFSSQILVRECRYERIWDGLSRQNNGFSGKKNHKLASWYPMTYHWYRDSFPVIIIDWYLDVSLPLIPGINYIDIALSYQYQLITEEGYHINY